MAKTVKITDEAYKIAVEKSGEKSVKSWISEKVTESDFGREEVREVLREELRNLRIDNRGNINLD